MKTALARLLALLLLAFGLAVGPVAAAAPAFPALTGRVVDQAGILPPGTAQAIAAKLEALEASTGRQFVVVTVSSLQGLEIEDYGHQLGRTWGIGEARKNTGVILLVAPDERRVRIEVGYGLEPILTDALSSKILQDNVLPLFRDGKMADGVVAGAEAIIAQLLLPPDQARAQAAEAADAQSAGGALPWMVVGFFVLWVCIGLIGSSRGRGVGAWLWPLFFLMQQGGRRGGDRGFRGGGGSFGGGGASGRW